uniref:hypothetical protein n=1 Tax=Citrobacter freundii TaxID=546 RepID=UPI00218223DE|nr:hypothetical protein [Citrobacter freundii]
MDEMIKQAVVSRSLFQNFVKNCILAYYLNSAKIKTITFNDLLKARVRGAFRE